MLGKCPHCKTDLKKPPFEGRKTNEVLLTIEYRKLIENNVKLASAEEKGYCELCNTKLKNKNLK